MILEGELLSGLRFMDHEQSRSHKPALKQHPRNRSRCKVWNGCVLPILAQIAVRVREYQIEVLLVPKCRKQVDEVSMFPFLELLQHGNFCLEICFVCGI
jgi:hypothetical protein